LTLALKNWFERPRPDIIVHELYRSTASFPSGHATMSALVYLTLAALVVRVIRDRRLKASVLAVAVLLTGLVGVTRVYLGFHWPSDVLAGWALGAAWALGFWTMAQLGRVGRRLRD
jgi:undecaprenyl-diphosphatase